MARTIYVSVSPLATRPSSCKWYKVQFCSLWWREIKIPPRCWNVHVVPGCNGDAGLGAGRIFELGSKWVLRLGAEWVLGLGAGLVLHLGAEWVLRLGAERVLRLGAGLVLVGWLVLETGLVQTIVVALCPRQVEHFTSHISPCMLVCCLDY